MHSSLWEKAQSPERSACCRVGNSQGILASGFIPDPADVACVMSRVQPLQGANVIKQARPANPMSHETLSPLHEPLRENGVTAAGSRAGRQEE